LHIKKVTASTTDEVIVKAYQLLPGRIDPSAPEAVATAVAPEAVAVGTRDVEDVVDVLVGVATVGLTVAAGGV